MIQINPGAYEALLGNIGKDMLSHAASCIGQCTGCMSIAVVPALVDMFLILNGR